MLLRDYKLRGWINECIEREHLRHFIKTLINVQSFLCVIDKKDVLLFNITIYALKFHF